jgi:hypothetical protein
MYMMFGFTWNCGYLWLCLISKLQAWLGSAEFESYLMSQNKSVRTGHRLYGSTPTMGLRLPDFQLASYLFRAWKRVLANLIERF